MNGEYIYGLLLDSHKYYVGKTTNITRRIDEHKNGVDGSAWTRKYPMKEVIFMEKVKTKYDEDNKVKDLMKEYGVDNVRGGSYSQLILEESVKSLLENEIKGAKNSCYLCGSASHYATNCPEKNTKGSASESKEGNSRKRGLDSTSSYKSQQEQPANESYKRSYTSNNNDYRNSKPKSDANSSDRNYTNHNDIPRDSKPSYSSVHRDYNSTGSKVPYESKPKNGSGYNDSRSSNQSDRHNSRPVSNHNDSRDSKPMNNLGARSTSNSASKFPPGHCFRCGRTSHYSPDCFATTDINGEIIKKD